MNPKYVTSKETSMKLKEAGAPQNSEFYWFDNPNSGKMELLEKKNIIGIFDKFIFSAYLTDELGEMLPVEIIVGQCKTLGGLWRFDFDDQQAITANTEPEARGLCLLYLIANKLISFEAKASESEGV